MNPKITFALALALALTLVSGSAFADSVKEIARVRVAMKSKVGISKQIGDVRLNVYKIDQGICGSAGNSIIAEFQVKHYERTFSDKKGVALKAKWETIKTYGIPLAEASQLSDTELKTSIMDSETCLE